MSALGNGVQADIRCFAGEMDQDIRGKRCGSDPGTHPHVIEPIEWVTDEASEHEMLVYYSLGNFVNWTSGTGEGVANRMVGGMAEVTITKKIMERWRSQTMG